MKRKRMDDHDQAYDSLKEEGRLGRPMARFDGVKEHAEKIKAIADRYNVQISYPTHDDYHIEGKEEDCRKAMDALGELHGFPRSPKGERDTSMNELYETLYGGKTATGRFGRKRTFEIPFKNTPPPETELGKQIKDNWRKQFTPIIQFGDMSEFEMRILDSLSAPERLFGMKSHVVCRGEKKFGFGCPFCEMLLDRYPEDRGEGGIE